MTNWLNPPVQLCKWLECQLASCGSPLIFHSRKCIHQQWAIYTVGREIFAIENLCGFVTHCITRIFLNFFFVVRGTRENFITVQFTYLCIEWNLRWTTRWRHMKSYAAYPTVSEYFKMDVLAMCHMLVTRRVNWISRILISRSSHINLLTAKIFRPTVPHSFCIHTWVNGAEPRNIIIKLICSMCRRIIIIIIIITCKIIQGRLINRKKCVQDGVLCYKHTSLCSPAFRC